MRETLSKVIKRTQASFQLQRKSEEPLDTFGNACDVSRVGMRHRLGYHEADGVEEEKGERAQGNSSASLGDQWGIGASRCRL